MCFYFKLWGLFLSCSNQGTLDLAFFSNRLNLVAVSSYELAHSHSPYKSALVAVTLQINSILQNREHVPKSFCNSSNLKTLARSPHNHIRESQKLKLRGGKKNWYFIASGVHFSTVFYILCDFLRFSTFSNFNFATDKLFILFSCNLSYFL